MTETTHPPFGIDLGTTNSAAACLDNEGRPRTLVNAEGDPLTPSVLLFDDGEVTVGKEAFKAASTAYERVVDCAKRQMGRRLHDKEIDGRSFPPEVLQAITLAKLRGDAEAVIGPIASAVVTVPAYFDEVRRKGTQDAAYMAGLQLLDIINEPTAAAIRLWPATWFGRGSAQNDFGLRPGRRDIRCHSDAGWQWRVCHAGHRRRRAVGRSRLG